MRRSILITTVILGGVLTLVGSTGVFAPFTDSGTVGTETPERVTSAARPKEADIKLAAAAPRTGCGTFSDDLVSGTLNATDLSSSQPQFALYCVRNDGAVPVRVSTDFFDAVDTDLGCTGDEAVVDTDCTPGARGEMSGMVFVQARADETLLTGCSAVNAADDLGFLDGSMHTGPLVFGPLDPGEIACVRFETTFFGGADVVLGQSDEVTYRIRLDAIES